MREGRKQIMKQTAQTTAAHKPTTRQTTTKGAKQVRDQSFKPSSASSIESKSLYCFDDFSSDGCKRTIVCCPAFAILFSFPCCPLARSKNFVEKNRCESRLASLCQNLDEIRLSHKRQNGREQNKCFHI